MRLNINDYREKVLGCWLGKNIGGTVGAPFEWKRQVNNITFYTQKDLNGAPMPNDDLDIQLLWLCAMEERGLNVTSHRLAEYWVTYVTPHWAEYGNGKINLRQGLPPPLSGTFANPSRHSCGAYIRSEIWACIAPGMPQVAARFAYEDAILDHGDGEGTFAEIFMAALESAAFVVGDLRRVIDIGLSYIPADSGVAKAVRATLDCFDTGKTWLETRDEVLFNIRGTRPYQSGRPAKGIYRNVPGYDVPSNIAFTLPGCFMAATFLARSSAPASTLARYGLHRCHRGIDLGHSARRQGCSTEMDRSDWPRHPYRLPESRRTGHVRRSVAADRGRTDGTAPCGSRAGCSCSIRAEHLCSDAPTDLTDINPDSLRAYDEGKDIWAAGAVPATTSTAFACM